MSRARRVVLVSVLVALAMMLAACQSTTSQTTGSNGDLAVAVTGLPTGIDASVTVTGPGGLSRAVTKTSTLQDLTVGSYSVSVAPVTDGSAIAPVGYDGIASVGAVNVLGGATASTTAIYHRRPGSGAMWIATYGSGPLVVGYQSGALAIASSSPDVVIDAVDQVGEDLAVDGSGDIWVSTAAGHIYEYRADSLAVPGTPSPNVTLDVARKVLTGLAFDGSGNLWVADVNAARLLMFTASQISTGGALTPSVTIGSTGGSLDRPLSLAFDASGNLWVSNLNASTVVAYSPAQLAAGGSPTPSVTISSDPTPSLAQPYGLAFDASGDLWVANGGSPNTVVRFDAAQLSTGAPTPAATIAASSLGGNPRGLAIDNSGALWVSDANTNGLRRFVDASSLSGDVTPAADIVLTGLPGGDLYGMAFSATPAGLPILTP